MRINYDEYVELYSKACDILWRFRADMPLNAEEDPDSPFSNTSHETRIAVNYLFKVLGLEMDDPEGKLESRMDKVIAYRARQLVQEAQTLADGEEETNG